MQKLKLYFILAVLSISQINFGQNGFDNYLSRDTVYRYNTSLYLLDSLLTSYAQIQNIDSVFLRTYSNGDGVNLNQLLFAAVNNNPQLIAMQTKIESLSPEAESKIYLPDPMFEAELDDIMTDFKKVGMINFYISQMFMFPGKLDLEKRTVLNQRDMMKYERLAMAADIMNMIKMNYYDLYLVNKKLQVNKDDQSIIKNIITAAEAQYMVGKGMQQEVFKAQTESLRLKNEQFILEQQKKNLLSTLTSLTKINLSESTIIIFSDINTDYLIDDANFNFNTEISNKLVNYAFEHRAEIKTLKNKILMNKTDIEMSEISRYPDLNLKLGYKILPFEETNALSIMVGINIPLAPWVSGRYENNIRKNEVLLKTTEDEISAKKTEIRGEIESIISNLKAGKESMKFYYSVQIPQTENTMKSSQYSYETNMGGFLDLLDSYRMYQESRVMYYEAVTMYLKMIAELEKAAALNLKD